MQAHQMPCPQDDIRDRESKIRDMEHQITQKEEAEAGSRQGVHM